MYSNLFESKPNVTVNTGPFVDQIRNLPSLESQVENSSDNGITVLFYFGTNGFRQKTVDDYREAITSLLRKDRQVVLMDLGGFKALRENPGRKLSSRAAVSLLSRLTQENDAPKIRNGFTSAFMYCLRRSPALKELLSRALRYDFIRAYGDRYPTEAKLGNYTFFQSQEFSRETMDADASTAYAALAYVGAIYQVAKLARASGMNRVSIDYLLANTDTNYYGNGPDDVRFQRDLTEYLATRANFPACDITVNFKPFRYGSNLQSRPYNTTNTSEKLESLDTDEVVGSRMRPA